MVTQHPKYESKALKPNSRSKPHGATGPKLPLGQSRLQKLFFSLDTKRPAGP